MPSSTVHLPNGHIFTVTPVFGGVTFKANDVNANHCNAGLPGWTIMIHTEKPSISVRSPRQPFRAVNFSDKANTPPSRDQSRSRPGTPAEDEEPSGVYTYRFTKPTLRNDVLFISSLYLPPSSEFKPATSPTRQIAMMLWATLWWYFHEPEPNPHIATEEASLTPEAGKPKADWRVYIKREGIFKGRNLMQKLERMGLVACEDSSVGHDSTEVQYPDGWRDAFVSRRSFWQIDPRIFFFTLPPAPYPPSPQLSRPSSPCKEPTGSAGNTATVASAESAAYSAATAGDPFSSGSHLPTYFPPPPPQYTLTHGIRHPIRQKPPRQGEMFYVRYVPSVNQYLSFRVPVLPAKAPGNKSAGVAPLSAPGSPAVFAADAVSDLEILHKWMNNPRVSAAWGVSGPQAVQERFLHEQLTSRHSFPAFGCWDGRPFGYFEIYWVKEDPLARLLQGPVDNWDRGFHCLVGEEEFRGSHRVAIWLSSLVHYCWLADNRTQTVMLEPRVDNTRYVRFGPLFQPAVKKKASLRFLFPLFLPVSY
jgi:hypothetical protein